MVRHWRLLLADCTLSDKSFKKGTGTARTHKDWSLTWLAQGAPSCKQLWKLVAKNEPHEYQPSELKDKRDHSKLKESILTSTRRISRLRRWQTVCWNCTSPQYSWERYGGPGWRNQQAAVTLRTKLWPQQQISAQTREDLSARCS